MFVLPEIPEQREPSFSEVLGSGLLGAGQAFGQAFPEFADAMQKKQQLPKQKHFISQLTGIDIDQLPDDPAALQELQKYGQQLGLQREKYSFEDMIKGTQKMSDIQEKVGGLQGATDIINRMRDIRANNRIGRGTKIRKAFDPATRKDAGEYSRLGKSLIQYSTNIPIRNQQEFKALAEDLYNPSISDGEAEGILDAMERIIMNSYGQLGMDVTQFTQTPESGKVLTKGAFAKLWEEAEQDPEKVIQLAQERGYQFK